MFRRPSRHRDDVVALAASVDTVLPPGLFAGVQGLDNRPRWEARQGIDLIWCAPAAEFVSRFPDLAPSLDEDDLHAPGACIDLVVEVDTDGLVTKVALESEAIDEQLIGRQVGEVREPLAAAVARVFGPD